ncbi:calmodulin-interacting protein 111-like isoform X1 [Zingiber officinale]|uniref:calmodulin-interacting protein 111-like isoform X1 n=1 Tax=Zingiber officinale TaxID=94328 RepID=UPI001C4D187E|nr:calmodulin-interacting protein 111-like isoform X1 [Zingiber officinale]XP_042413842.1 calmodulin-interacting protein 111-like isoform X1 [Zingiber officinale]XP_042413843.1 calmodulin-interacting protein 111-like isoform X1 [Zingiber officinale]
MPKKGKKSSRASPPSTLSDRSPGIPETPKVSSLGVPSNDDDEVIRRHRLASAAARFPALLDEERTLCGRTSNTEPSTSDGNRATVWLSQAAMISNSFAHNSVVSVSLPALDNANLTNFPLKSLTKECSSQFGYDAEDHTTDTIGSYFAIAYVSSSHVVVKNEARLSWALSRTLGSPAPGRAVFICPVETLTLTSSLNNSVGSTPYFSKCKDLYLKLLLPKPGLFRYSRERKASTSGPSSGHPPIKMVEIALPRTPNQNKSSSYVVSPMSSKSSNKVTSISDSLSDMDASILKLAVEDERIKEIVQSHASVWLCGRRLFKGNFVSVPIGGPICVFMVEGSDMPLEGFSSKEVASDKSDLLHNELQISSLDKLDPIFVLDSTTKVHLSTSTSMNCKPSNEVQLDNGYANCKLTHSKEANFVIKLGGLHKEFAALKEIILSLLADPRLRYKGVLLHGPPGTGKTSLVTSCAHAAGVRLFSINGPEVISEYYGESEQALCKVFNAAKQASPSVVFIDELDVIAPARRDGGEDLSLRMVGTLLVLLDEINKNDRVLVIAATNRPNSIDPALRRLGRLEREIEIGVPSPEQRLDILRTILNDMTHSLSNIEIQSLASGTHGFVGADLTALCNEAAMNALRRYIEVEGIDYHFKLKEYLGSRLHKDVDAETTEQIDLISSSLSALNMSSEQASPVSGLGRQDNCNMSVQGEKRVRFALTLEDFDKAKLKVRPSAMREVMLELPKVKWEDVGGQAMIKQQLIEAVQWPQLSPDAFKRVGIRPPRGLLMIGPPGCSKTLMARAVASEAKLNFLAVKGPELFSKWVGESEKAVKALFAKARINSPAIVFFDEIDGLAGTRGQDSDSTSVGDRVLSQLLVEMDGLHQRAGVVVIAATNRPDKIDPALLRPGRFDRVVDVQPPDENDREDIFRIHLRNIPCSSDVSIRDLAQLTQGYTGADIKLVCREAAIAALEESLEATEVSMMHFKSAISQIEPSDLKFYIELAAQFRRLVV